MIIKEIYIKSFGKFVSEKIEFEDKINIVTGDNESGKSTIVNFIKYMLYGKLDKNPRVNKELLKSYETWNENLPLGGSMTIDVSGRLYRIEREQRATARYAVYDVISGDKAEKFMTDSIGKILFSVDVDTFEKTAYIRQSEIEIGKSAELEVKLRSLLSGMQSDVSFESVKKVIENAKRQNDSARTQNSLLEKSKARLISLESELVRSRELSERYIKAREEIAKDALTLEGLRREERELESKKEHAKIGRAHEKLSLVEKIMTDHEQTKIQFDKLEETLVYENHEADIDYINTIDSITHNVVLREQTKRDYEMQLERLNAEKNVILSQISSYQKLSDDSEKVRQLTSSSKKLGTRWRLFVAIGCFLIAVIALFSFIAITKSPIMLVMLIVFFILSVIFFILHSTTSEHRISNKMAKKYGYQGIDELNEALGELLRLIEKNKNLDSETLRIKQQLEFAGAEYNNKIGQLKELCALHGKQIENYEQANRFSKMLEQDIKTKQMLEARMAAYDDKLAIILGEDSYNELKKLVLSAPLPKENEDEIEEELKNMRACINDLTIVINTKKTSNDSMFKNVKMPDEIASEILEEEKNNEEILKTSDALSIAAQYLESAYERLQDDFVPEVNKKSGENLEKITDYKYSGVVMNSENRIKLIDRENTHKLESYSAGTRDAVYLAVRLAVTQMIYRENTVPIIIDDSLSRMDETRLKNTVNTLHSVSENNQILLFSCRNNEAQCLKNLANILKI